MGLFDYPIGTTKNVMQDELIFLEHWKESDWECLKGYLQHQTIRGGETLFYRNETSQYLSIVIEGQLGVFVQKEGSEQLMHVSTMTEGSVVGEQAFIDGLERSADVKALTPVELMNLSMQDFNRFKQGEPELAQDLIFDLARILSIRLRKCTTMLSGR